jgi:hypothetical protein
VSGIRPEVQIDCKKGKAGLRRPEVDMLLRRYAVRALIASVRAARRPPLVVEISWRRRYPVWCRRASGRKSD